MQRVEVGEAAFVVVLEGSVDSNHAEQKGGPVNGSVDYFLHLFGSWQKAIHEHTCTVGVESRFCVSTNEGGMVITRGQEDTRIYSRISVVHTRVTY